MKPKPKAIDLFSGAGGLSEGLKQAGFNVVGAVEIDALAAETYALNHETTRIWQTDIRKLTGPHMMRELGIAPGTLDVLAACPPCQGFSKMRTKNGRHAVSEPQNDLIFEVLRITRSVRPRTLMIENVPGLAKDPRFQRFVNALTTLGYDTRWSIFNTADFAVPQRRSRLVLLASLCGVPNFAKPARQVTTVRDAIGGLTCPSKSNDPLHNYRPAPSAKTQKLIRMIPRNGGSRTSLAEHAQLDCHVGFNGFRDVYGRMAWERPAPTITSGCINPSKGRFLHPTANRAITLREAALLQSFPIRYQFQLTRGRYAVALLIGNALPPEFIRRQAMMLLQLVAGLKPPKTLR